jgi:hypothetical protein
MDKIRVFGVVILCICILTIAIVASLTYSNANANNLNNIATPTATPNNIANNPTSTTTSAESTTNPNTSTIANSTNTPTPSSVQTANVTLSYHEKDRTEVGNDTRLKLSITANLTSGDSATIDYSNVLLYVWIEGSNGQKGLLNLHHYTCLESGATTLDFSQKSAVFTLTFQFPTDAMGFDGYVVPFSTYTLSYLGQPVAQQ